MEFLSWLKKVFTPQPAGMGRGLDSSRSWTASSSRDDGSDVFNDSYFNGSRSDQGDGSGSSDGGSEGGGDGGGGSD